ncbi:MAG: DUF2169 domain-containing protein [Proteobacteria bacterium]|nr:DUF2169 domain-containing protein [Pseudomonadota bacterium]
MWSINNETPFEAKGTVRLDHKTSHKIWLVAVKATFDIHMDGTLSISEIQEEVLEEPVYSCEEGSSSLIYDSDLFGYKDNVDVILNSSGYQPDGVPQKDLIVGVTIGNWGKSLKLIGDRLWDRFLGVTLKTDPQPFKKIAIQYENAYGGTDKKAKQDYLKSYNGNNIGKGYASKKRHLFSKRLPNIEYPDFPTKANYKKNKVAGFSAIPNYLKPRIDFSGTYDENWQSNRAPFFPEDFSALYYQSAPLDQQLPHLFGGEKVSLFNLIPNKSEFSFCLPELEFNLMTKTGDSIKQHKADIKTIVLEPDHPRVMITWQSFIDCHEKDHLVETTTVEVINHNVQLLLPWQNTELVESLLQKN